MQQCCKDKIKEIFSQVDNIIKHEDESNIIISKSDYVLLKLQYDGVNN